MVDVVSYLGLVTVMTGPDILHLGIKIVLDYHGTGAYTLAMLNRTMEIDMTQFYFRHGTALSEKDNARVQVGARGESGYLNRAENCPRCGGAGGSVHWRPDGGFCYQCHGNRTIPVTRRVFSEIKLTQLDEAAAKKAEIKAAEAQRNWDAARANFEQWCGPHKNLLGAIMAATGNSFLSDLASRLKASRPLTERQLEAAATAIERQKQRETEGRESEYVGEVKDRIEFEAEVTGVYGTEGFYGHTDIVKFKDADNNQFTWFASDYTNLRTGDRISIKGTVKKHDDYRDIKQTVLTRCKYTKFEVMTPDEAAQMEAVI